MTTVRITESRKCPSRGCENTIGDGSVVPLDRSMCGDCWSDAEQRIAAFRRIVEREPDPNQNEVPA